MAETAEQATSAPTTSIDVWSWSTQKTPALEDLLAVRQAVLTEPEARRAFEDQVAQLGEDPADPQVAGLARWILCEYPRAWSHLEGLSKPSPAVRFAKAECCLKGRVAAGDRRPMRRPDLAAKLLAGHPEREKDELIYATWLEALAWNDDREALEKGVAATPAALKGTAMYTSFEGLMAEQEGDYGLAESKYREALQIDPEHRQSLLRLAYQLDLGGDDDEALGVYARLSKLEPLDVHATINYGVLLEDRDRYGEAISCYRAVLRQYPNHARAWSYLRDAQGSLNMVFDEDVERRHDKRNRLLRIPINDFELSVRARNCLAKMKIETLGDLVQRTEAELLAYKNFGETSLNEIKVLLEAKGLRLGMNLDEDPLPMHPLAAESQEAAPVDLPPGVDPAVLGTVLADLELSVRCRKALSQIKAVTIADLLSHTEAELLALKNFGSTSLSELKTRLTEHGICIRPS